MKMPTTTYHSRVPIAFFVRAKFDRFTATMNQRYLTYAIYKCSLPDFHKLTQATAMPMFLLEVLYTSNPT